MTGGRRAGAGSTNVGLAGEESASELSLQVLVRSFSETCTLYTAKVPRPRQMLMERLLKIIPRVHLPISRATRQTEIKRHLLNQVPQRHSIRCTPRAHPRNDSS